MTKLDCWTVRFMGLALLAGAGGLGCQAQPSVVLQARDGGPGTGGSGDASIIQIPDGGLIALPDGGGFGPPKCTKDCSDFDTGTIVDDNTPANVQDSFKGTHSGTAAPGGPCLLEPQDNALFPSNWLRPRFNIKPQPGQTAFEIRLHNDVENKDLVVYTANQDSSGNFIWTMPAATWSTFSRNASTSPTKFTVRALGAGGTVVDGTVGSFQVAPVTAAGTIVYWTTGAGTVFDGSMSRFKGFTVGDEKVEEVMSPAQVGTGCVGCHTSTPDGLYVAFAASAAGNSGDGTSVDIRAIKNPGQMLSISPSAITLLSRVDQTLASFSKSHWTTGDRIMLSTLLDRSGSGNPKNRMIWTDLDATSAAENAGWGYVVTSGDDKEAGGPAFSHDGSFIVYTSATNDGQQVGPTPFITNGDIYKVPFAAVSGSKGGAATPVSGAATDANEYYPSLSADDKFVAYNIGTNYSYNNPSSEVWIAPVAGGPAAKIVGNTPCTCLGKSSPGVTNSWPKWSPTVETSGSTSYYWIIFSSDRILEKVPQLYVAGMSVNELGAITTYSALYLWNQPPAEKNHTPAWDVFMIPPIM